MKGSEDLGRGRYDFWSDVAMVILAFTVLLGCKVAESIELNPDGSGTQRIETEFSSSEIAMMGNPKAQLTALLEKNPKLALVGEGERNGGRYYILEQRFESVSELNEEGATYDWDSRKAEEKGGAKVGDAPFGSLFHQRHKLHMQLDPPRTEAGMSIASYSLEIKVPGRVSATNGKRVGGNRVEWDRLASDGSGDLWIEMDLWRFPRPGDVVSWYSERYRNRYFDDNALAWIDGGRIWVGDPFSEDRRAVAEVGEVTSLQAGGSRLLWYRSRQDWDRLGPAEATILDLEHPSETRVLTSVSGPALSPDGLRVAFGKFHNPTAEWGERRGAGFSLLDLEADTETVIARELPMPDQGRARRYETALTDFDWKSWLYDEGQWSVDGTELFVSRYVLAREDAVGFGSHGWTGDTFTYATDSTSIDWRVVVCDDEKMGLEVFTAIGSKAFTGSNPRICETETGENLLRSMRSWPKLLTEYPGLSSAAYSRAGQLAVLAGKSFIDREGRPGVVYDLIVGEGAGPRVIATLHRASGEEAMEVESTAFGLRARRLSWHPTRPVLAFENVIIDVEGQGGVKTISATAKHAAWVVAPREVFPSLKAMQLLILVAYWLAGALALATAALGLRSAFRWSRSRRPLLGGGQARLQPQGCAKCGKAVEVGARFCRHCGTPVVG